jgi:hypothetical protein
MRGNPLFALVIPAEAGNPDFSRVRGRPLDPGSSPGGFPRAPSGKNFYIASG